MTTVTSQPEDDRKLVGAVVRREIARQHGTVSATVRTAPGISRKTIERVMDGDPGVERERLEYLEGRLGLPRDTLLFVGHHDATALEQIGVDPDLIRWMLTEMRSTSRTDAQDAANG